MQHGQGTGLALKYELSVTCLTCQGWTLRRSHELADMSTEEQFLGAVVHVDLIMKAVGINPNV